MKPGCAERAPSAPLRANASPLRAARRGASVALWLRTWQATYPEIDFAERLDWWRERWRNELLPVAEVVIAETDGAMVGFVTVDPRTLYLDQIVVAPEHWRSSVGSTLLARGQAHFAGWTRSSCQHRQRARHRLLRQARLRHQRRRQQSDHRPAGASHELAAVTIRRPGTAAWRGARKGRRGRPAPGACPLRRCGLRPSPGCGRRTARWRGDGR